MKKFSKWIENKVGRGEKLVLQTCKIVIVIIIIIITSIVIRIIVNVLTVSQTSNFKLLFQTERVCRPQSNNDENDRKFSKRVENTVRKGEKKFCRHIKNLSLYSPTILENILSLVLQIFLYSEAFECNTTSDWVNHKV